MRQWPEDFSQFEQAQREVNSACARMLRSIRQMGALPNALPPQTPRRTRQLSDPLLPGYNGGTSNPARTKGT